MKLFIAATVFGLGAANIANEGQKMCLDIKTMCIDGSDKAGCKRQAAKDLTKGANLQMWKCNDKENQKFEIIDGRLHNTLTGLCVDIKAECADGSNEPKCKRQSLDDIKDEANVQLWTCRKDDPEGFNSSSYGNQKFDLMKDGSFSNSRTGFCLTAHKGEGDATNGANVHINKCGKMDGPGEDPADQVFYWKAVVEANDFTRLVEVGETVQLPAPAATWSPAAFSAMAVGACASAALAAVAVVRSLRPSTERLPMTNECE